MKPSAPASVAGITNTAAARAAPSIPGALKSATGRVPPAIPGAATRAPPPPPPPAAPPTAPQKDVYKALYNFAGQEGEMKLVKGEEVEVKEKDDNGQS
jgi:myosin-1